MSAPDTDCCPNCFSARSVMPCPQCGWQPGLDNPPPALALGTVLDGRYRIGRVLGHGGFGITYLAWDENLYLRLAIKEYLPRDTATRAPDGVSMAIYSGQAGEQFAYGLERFIDEARALARFDQHPGIVTVKNFFRAHGTGYCVMDYVEGITLRQYLEQQPGGKIGVEAAWKLLMPVMDALRAVHKEGLLHRDIAPDNIYLGQDGRVKLLDFGAARYAAGEHSKSLSMILKPGYSPEEQYRTKGKQGPWTDVYGLAATCYRSITGQAPPEALDRLHDDDLVPPSRMGVAIQPEQEAVLLKALAVTAAQRYQSVEELQQGWRTGSADSRLHLEDKSEVLPKPNDTDFHKNNELPGQSSNKHVEQSNTEVKTHGWGAKSIGQLWRALFFQLIILVISIVIFDINESSIGYGWRDAIILLLIIYGIHFLIKLVYTTTHDFKGWSTKSVGQLWRTLLFQLIILIISVVIIVINKSSIGHNGREAIPLLLIIYAIHFLVKLTYTTIRDFKGWSIKSIGQLWRTLLFHLIILIISIVIFVIFVSSINESFIGGGSLEAITLLLIIFAIQIIFAIHFLAGVTYTIIRSFKNFRL